MRRGALWRLFYRASLADHSYKFLFRPGPEGEAVSLDCETTGLDPRTDDVVAVAAVRIRGDRILLSERFEATVRPEDARSSSDAIKIHRLRERDARPVRGVDRVRAHCRGQHDDRRADRAAGPGLTGAARREAS